jgi:hypothetical protein
VNIERRIGRLERAIILPSSDHALESVIASLSDDELDGLDACLRAGAQGEPLTADQAALVADFERRVAELTT